jgi:hypothetical protein
MTVDSEQRWKVNNTRLKGPHAEGMGPRESTRNLGGPGPSRGLRGSSRNLKGSRGPSGTTEAGKRPARQTVGTQNELAGDRSSWALWGCTPPKHVIWRPSGPLSFVSVCPRLPLSHLLLTTHQCNPTQTVTTTQLTTQPAPACINRPQLTTPQPDPGERFRPLLGQPRSARCSPAVGYNRL